MSATQAHDIIAAMGLNRPVHTTRGRFVPYVKGSERWEGPDAISYLERRLGRGTERTLICRHNDWRGACLGCARRFYPPLDERTADPSFREASD